ncbi:hypothetical protein PIROE2DRAFT_19062 [Piromyces sp. E2]|nr:hypothetical protein PIROE2DRAFT_19062 [Piromyces sp. E2]|eukprot:OUM56356.1 hypothetical protein PIROE2DRAFT_19062 [Piromyces sp. E2]
MKCALYLVSLLLCLSAVFSYAINENHLAKRASMRFNSNKLYHIKKDKQGKNYKRGFEYISLYDGQLYAEDDDQKETYIFNLVNFDKNKCKNYNDRNLTDVYLTDANGKRVTKLFNDQYLGKNRNSEVTVHFTLDNKCKVSSKFSYYKYDIHHHRGK